jgi:integrase
MARQTLTDIALQKLQPVDGRQTETWDAKMPGFGVRVSPSGTKSFVLMYRHSGRPRRLTIGRYPVLSLADARKLAQKALAKIAEGADPVAEKQSQAERNLDVFAVVVDEFVRLHCNRHNRENSARETERLLKVEFVPKWRKRDIKTIAKADVIRVIDAIVERGSPGAAHHAFAAIRKLFNWCVERGLIDASPCAGLKSPTKQKPRDRVLSDDELASVWRAATQVGYPVGPITQLLILTGQRRGEVAGMRWSDIDLKEALWTLPGELTKNARPHQVPLSQEASRIISSLPQLDDLYVFPARGRKQQPFMGFNKGKLRLDAASGVEEWTFHDLRRTAATGMAQLGVPPHVVERVLNHVSGTFGGVAGIYNRFGYLPEMRAAMEAWDARVSDLLKG